MRVARSNRFFLNPNENETHFFMAKDGYLVKDMEEGEISDETTSIEEISEADFKQEAKVSKSKPKGDSRVWMGDLLKYSLSSNYAPGLHNFAWAQAVQNKPLNEILARDVGSDEKSKRSASNLFVNTREDNNKRLNFSKELCSVIIDDSSEEIDSRMEEVGGGEKEEGELEEGEIELDSEMIEKTEEPIPSDESEIDSKDRDFEKRIQLIREALVTVTVEDAEKSFHGVCSQMRTSMESLQLIVLENRVPAIDALIQQSFTGIQTVNSVFCSMTKEQQEQNKDVLSRLLAHVKSQDPALFSLEQMKEIEAMMHSLDSRSVSLSAEAMDKVKEMQINNVVNPNELAIENPGRSLNSLKKFHLEPLYVKSGDQNNANSGSESMKPGLFTGSKVRGGFGSLVDLHRDHDADSLPSPTREPLQFLPIQKPWIFGDGTVKSDLVTTRVVDKAEDATVHPYETDALKAVSTYQQKFGWNSFLPSNRLPSPTPSEECDGGNGESNEEVSSSPNDGNVRTVNPSVPLQPFGSATPHVDDLSVQELVPAKSVVQLTSASNPVLRAPAKSRDPRLQFSSSEVGALDLNQRPLSVEYNAPKSESIGGITSSRKHKIVEESLLDGHTLKRQRNGLTGSGVSRDAHTVSGSGGWLEDSTVGPQPSDRNHFSEKMGTDLMKSENGEIDSSKRQDSTSGKFNVKTGGNEQLPMSSTSTSTSTMGILPSLLKDIAVNPTILMQLIMEQQRLAADAQRKSGDPVQNKTPISSSSVVPLIPLANVTSSDSSEIVQKSKGKPQIPAQTASTNPQSEWGKIRMKPRDPRRILHSSTIQKNESLGPEQLKTNRASSSITQASKDNLTVRQQGEQAQTTSLPSQSAPPLHITRQFTKKLKNLTNILSSSQAANTPMTVSQTVSFQPPFKTDKADVRVVATDCNDQQSGTGSTPEESAVGPPQSQNAWGDVEHLFEGYDDQQKAAIQRERARRIEEQNKMLAARKLCLVLDLDHTLLNSAKFVEVDPVHDEILRKKEEQDREKPQRHLFRFPHIGMWTKLRPGIWNFLEKATKLYELHLYTMGNKLYATEMAKVLDPSGNLFSGRVISKGDDGDLVDGDERVPKCKDLDGVLGMESDVVIIDDSVRVWPHNKPNLIVVERYTYFPCSRRQFGLLGPSLLEIDHDERPEDGTMASSLAVIERIHQNFFSHRSFKDVDVRNILALEQRKILAGCRIVFSRVFPVGEANPHLHPLWLTAEQFGAVCTNQIDEQVTHVVANSLGTDKVNWALSTGRFVVHPGWVEASALLYRRATENDFAIKL